MCTLIALHRVHATPLIVAANRDEFYDRPAVPPAVLSESPRVVAGRDLASGGTWLGATSGGLFVGLTNQRAWSGPVAGERSRGEIVRDALARGSVVEVERYLDALDPRRYAGFNLLYGDGQTLRVAYGRPTERTVERHTLPPGVHVLTNDRLGSPDFPKAERARHRARPLVGLPLPELLRGLQEVLADRSLPPLQDVPPPPRGSFFDHALTRRLQALCVETPRYGTVSATILAIDRRVRAHLYADGPPGQAPWRDLTAFHEDGAAAGTSVG